MKQINISKSYVIAYTHIECKWFNYYDKTCTIAVQDDITIEQFDTQQESINRLLELNFNTFEVPREIYGLELEYKKPVYGNVLTSYADGEAVYSDNVLTGYVAETGPEKIKKIKVGKMRWKYPDLSIRVRVRQKYLVKQKSGLALQMAISQPKQETDKNGKVYKIAYLSYIFTENTDNEDFQLINGTIVSNDENIQVEQLHETGFELGIYDEESAIIYRG